MEKATRIMMELPDWVKESMMDFQLGSLRHKGKRLDVVAVVLDHMLTEDEATELKRMRRCVKVSCGHWQYAPEIKRAVLYFKY